MTKLKLQDLDLKNKKVLMRVDFNIPMDSDGNITDDTRITAALSSINYVLEKGGSLVLMSHLGKPKNSLDLKLSLRKVAVDLSKKLNKEVLFSDDCIGESTQELKGNLLPGQILLLENLRFYEAEKKPEKDPNFSRQLAEGMDYYVNDAFGTCHRSHSSITEVTKFFPNKSAQGLLVEKELSFLNEKLKNPKRPFVALIGGAKISSKIGVIVELFKQVDSLLIGGAMAHTFFKAQNLAIGKSLCEDEALDKAREILDLARNCKVQFLLPIDLVVADIVHQDSKAKIVDVQDGLLENDIGLDIGPKTIELYLNVLKDAQTVFWNGPMGLSEIKQFAKGTEELAHFLAHSSSITIIGGGDSAAAIDKLGLKDHFTHISTGGGASLEYIEKGHLPGLEILSDL